jgi:hypothetical protein
VRQDAPVPEVEAPDLHRADVHLLDALDAAHQDAMDAAGLRRESSDGDAGKSAVPELDVRARDASSRLVPRPVPLARQDAEAVPCTRDAAQSEERSCAALEAAAGRQAQPDELGPLGPEEQPML